MDSWFLAHWRAAAILLVGTAFLQTSCSHARKSGGKPNLLVAEVIGEPVLTDEKIEALKEIAEDPSSQLAEESVENIDPISPSLDPSLAWKKGDFDPRVIHPGDVFFEQAGAILHKAASIADTYSPEEWENVLHSYGKRGKRIVPLTLSHGEILELAQETGGQLALPTRSVALDFNTVRLEIEPRKIESYFREITRGPSPAQDSANRRVLSESLADLSSRISKGEEFFVVTAVTSSDEVRISYPGAPIGKRDSDLVLNALSALYPHLDQLRPEMDGSSILVTRDPKIYWEFEASRIVLENGELKVQRNEPAPLFSFLSFQDR